MSTSRIACWVSSELITGPTVVRLRCASIGPRAASSAVTSVPISPVRVTPPGTGVGEGEGLGLGDAAGDAEAPAAAAEPDAAGLADAPAEPDAAGEADGAAEAEVPGEAEVAGLAAADGATLPDAVGDELGADVAAGPWISPSGTVRIMR